MYERARDVLERLDMHIFRGNSLELSQSLAAVRSLLVQGFNRGRGCDGAYFKYLKNAFQCDRQLLRQVQGEATQLYQFWREITTSAKSHIELDPHTAERFNNMLHYAHDALMRYGTDRKLAEISDYVQAVRDSLDRGSIALEEAQSVYEGAVDYLKTKRAMFSFPGTNLVKAFELAIMGLHYETVVGNVLAENETSPLAATGSALDHMDGSKFN